MEQLGHGGMAVVFKVEHMLLKTFRAMKVIRSEVSDNPIHVARFEREARLLVSLDHPNLVRVHDFFRESGSLFLVMEYVPGESLAQRLNSENSLSIPDVHEIVEQACAGLAYAHQQGIIHRDLSPDNLMITQKRDGTEHIQIIDFGIAKALEEDVDASKSVFETTSGKFVGKPSYCSPEQAEGKTVDHHSDIYSLGLIIYRSLTGEMAFSAKSYLETILARTTRSPRTLAESAPDKVFSRALEAVIARALAREPDDRYESMDDFLTALRKAFRQCYREEQFHRDRKDATVRRESPHLLDQMETAGDDDSTQRIEFDTGASTIRIPEMKIGTPPEAPVQSEPVKKPVVRKIPVSEPPVREAWAEKPEALRYQMETAPAAAPAAPAWFRSRWFKSLLSVGLVTVVMVAGVVGTLIFIQKTGLETDIMQGIQGNRRQGSTPMMENTPTVRAAVRATEPSARVIIPVATTAGPVESATPRRTATPSPTPEPTMTSAPTATSVPETVVTAIVGRQGALPEIKMISVAGETFVRFDDRSGLRFGEEMTGQTVKLTRKYMITATEITQALYRAVTGTNPSEFKGDNLPVHNVSWYEAVEFCNMLSQWEGLFPAYVIERTDRRYTITWRTLSRGYRLPTEAEWEFASRGRTVVRYTSGNELLKTHGYFNAKDGPRTVGLLTPNYRGLFDVHGNVREWVWDGSGTFMPESIRDYGGNPAADTRVIRGGAWNSIEEECGFTRRQTMRPYESDNMTGFRIVRLQ